MTQCNELFRAMFASGRVFAPTGTAAVTLESPCLPSGAERSSFALASLGGATPKLLVAVMVLVGIMLGTSVSFAQDFRGTPFSADMTMKMKAAKDMTGKIYFSGNKMRHEINTEGRQVIQILDLDRKVAKMLMPQQKMYMEMKMNDDQSAQQRSGPRLPDLKAYDPSNPCAHLEMMTCDKVGSETVNGRSTDKWIFKNNETGELTTTWIDRKISYAIRTITKDMQVDLGNVREGMPEASLFEVPDGYRKFDMGGTMGGRMPHPRESQ